MSIPKEFQEIVLKGYPICSGIAIAKPFFFTVPEEKIPEIPIAEDQIEGEVARYYQALTNSRRDVLTLQQRLAMQGGAECVAILSGHLEMLHDPMMTVQMEEQIRVKGKNTEYVFKSFVKEYERKFSKITDQFFRERLKDFQDISRRIISYLRHNERSSLADIRGPVVIFAHELSPSDTTEAPECTEAFVTRSGTETSHVAIIGRSRGIPFVSNVEFPDLSLTPPPLVIVDGDSGDVIIHPSEVTLKFYQKKQRKLSRETKQLRQVIPLASETIDGYRIQLSANVEMPTDIENVLSFGAEGVGLFRSEYLFLMNNSFPSEEDQFNVYRHLVEKVSPYPSIIRTFDIGGDKIGDFYPTRYEENPFLGCRAIRLMLKERNAFKIQLRAILRASAFGELQVLFPMVSSLAELRAAKALIEEIKEELQKEGIPFARSLPIGCMIEVPSAAMTCDLLIKECDFLSIGTNDLVQYSLAVDRGNPSMGYLYAPADPSIIRFIKMVVDEGTRAKKRVTLCGEMAGNPEYLPLLIGLGVQDFSLAPPAIPLIKSFLRKITLVEAIVLAEKALQLSTPEEVEQLLQEKFQEILSI